MEKREAEAAQRVARLHPERRLCTTAKGKNKRGRMSAAKSDDDAAADK